MILDRFAVTPVGRCGAAPWTAATALTATAGGFGGVILARVLLGIAEAPAFPGNAKATGYWFPRSERSMAIAIFDAAAKFSNVIGAPLVALSVIYFGWRGAWLHAAQPQSLGADHRIWCLRLTPSTFSSSSPGSAAIWSARCI